MNRNQRDFLGRQTEYEQLSMVSASGLNPGICQDGANTMQGGCANIVEIASIDPFVGMWDIESHLNMYVGDNVINHDYSLYCRYQNLESPTIGTGVCRRNDDFQQGDKPEGINDWALHEGQGFRTCDRLNEQECAAMCRSMDGCNMFAYDPANCCFPFRSTNMEECNPDSAYQPRYSVHRLQF